MSKTNAKKARFKVTLLQQVLLIILLNAMSLESMQEVNSQTSCNSAPVSGFKPLTNNLFLWIPG